MATISTFHVALAASTNRFISSISQAERRWNSFARSVQRHAKTMPEAIRKATAPSLALGRQVAKAAAVAGAALSGMAGWGVKLAADWEQTQIAFETMLGSAEAARRFLADLEQFATDTPFDADQIINAARQLLAWGFAAEEVRAMLVPLGNAVAGLGGSADKLDSIIRALGQIRAKGRLQAEEMLQLTEAGVNAWEYLAQAMGVSVAEAMDRVTKRQVDAATAIQAILRGMARDPRFMGMMERQSRTLAAQFERLQENWRRLSRGMGQDVIRILGLARALEWVNNAVARLAYLTGQYGSFLRALEAAFPPWLSWSIVAIAGAITGALVPAITAALIPALKKLVTSLGLTAAVLGRWAVGGAIVAVAAVLIIKHWRMVPAALKAFAYAAAGFVVGMAATAVRWVGWMLKAIGFIIPWFRRAGDYLLGLSARMDAFGIRLFRMGQAAWAAAKSAGVSIGRLREMERVTNGAAKGAQRLGDAARRAADAQEKLAKGLKKVGDQASDNIQAFDEVHRLETQLGDAGGGIGDVSIPAVKAYEDWANILDNIASGIGNIGTAMENLAGGMGGPTSQMLSLWDRIKQGAKDLWERVVDWWTRTKEGVINRAREIWQGVTNWWNEKKTSVITRTREIWEGVANWWAQIKANVVTRAYEIWQGVVNWWERTKADVVARVQGIWQGVVDWWERTKTDIVLRAQAIWQNVVAWWDRTKTDIGLRLQGIWQSAVEWWERTKTDIGLRVQGIWQAVVQWWERTRTDVGLKLQSIWQAAVSWWDRTKADVGLRVQGIWQGVVNWWEKTRLDVAARLQGIWQSAVDWWSKTKQDIVSRVEGTYNSVSDWWEKTEEKLGSIWSNIKRVARDTWEQIKADFRNAINTIIGYVNRLIDAINRIEIGLPAVDIPFVGRIGGWSIRFFSIPKIPYLAKGGIVTDPTLAVVGERGPEAVLPLSGPAGSSLIEAIRDAVAEGTFEGVTLAERNERATTDFGPQELVFKIDGRAFARLVWPYIVSEARRQGMEFALRPSRA